jgi:N-acetylglucosamine-6-phosphate deacetylase
VAIVVMVSAPALLLGGRLSGPGAVVIEDGRVREVLDAVPPPAPDHVALASGVLSSGLLDVQNNGSFGVDFAAATPQQWVTVLAGLAGRGVTGVQPTIITAPLDDLTAAFARARTARQASAGRPVCQILGVHLEGPFIAPARKGAHRAELMVDPDPRALEALLGPESTREVLLTVTLAPERRHALTAIGRLVEAGLIVSVGHTDATADQVWAAADAGATMTTHIFNAQRPFGHREPGVPGAVLADPRFHVGTIIDGQHLHPAVVGIVYAAAPGRVVGVTDAIVTAGLPNGTPLQFGGQPVSNDEQGLGRRPDGTIAGAGIVLDEGIRRMIKAGLDPAAVLTSCTQTAARSIGRTDVGHLAPGACADLVWWDHTWTPRRIWIAGQEIPAAQ